MALQIVDDRPHDDSGIYIGGYNIAPNVLLIRAESFETAWEAMVDTFADAGSLAACDHRDEDDEGSCDAHDYGSMGGPWVTLDLVLRTVRRGRRD